MSVRKICVFLFVNCVIILPIANTFVASYAMKYSEIVFVFRNFLAYTPLPPQLYMLATALVPTDSTCMLAFLNESPRQSVEIELLIEQAVQFQIHSSVIFVVRNVSFIVTMKILKTILFPSKVLQICNV
jgi:hypothetical protein